MLLADLLLPGSLLSPRDRLKGTATDPQLPEEKAVVELSMGGGQVLWERAKLRVIEAGILGLE